MTGTVLVSPQDLAAMPPAGVVLLDTRDPAGFAAGHIPGAVNVHDVFTYLATSSRDGIAAMRGHFAEVFGAAGLSGAETAVVYEQAMNAGFGQSCRGYVLLRYLGYPDVKVLHGGFAGWSAAGLPVTAEASTPEPRVFPLGAESSDLLVDVAAMRAAVADPAVVKLDVRDVDEWIGASSSPYGPDFCPRKGRIPGARWLEWYRMMKPTPAGPMMKAPAEILAECESVGITVDTPVVLYCFKGARASNTLVALKEAGVKDVRLYFGSWNEWSRDPSLPIELAPGQAAPAPAAAMAAE